MVSLHNRHTVELLQHGQKYDKPRTSHNENKSSEKSRSDFSVVRLRLFLDALLRLKNPHDQVPNPIKSGLKTTIRIKISTINMANAMTKLTQPSITTWNGLFCV